MHCGLAAGVGVLAAGGNRDAHCFKVPILSVNWPVSIRRQKDQEGTESLVNIGAYSR